MKELNDRLQVVEAVAHHMYSKYNTNKGMVCSLTFFFVSDGNPQLHMFYGNYGEAEPGISLGNQYRLFAWSSVSYAYYHMCQSIVNFRNQERLKGKISREIFSD